MDVETRQDQTGETSYKALRPRWARVHITDQSIGSMANVARLGDRTFDTSGVRAPSALPERPWRSV